jgi:pimeloyl-ACP methyl ester carboxylesterase
MGAQRLVLAQEFQNRAIEKLRLLPIRGVPGFGNDKGLGAFDPRRKEPQDRWRRVEIGIAGQKQSGRLDCSERRKSNVVAQRLHRRGGSRRPADLFQLHPTRGAGGISRPVGGTQLAKIRRQVSKFRRTEPAAQAFTDAIFADQNENEGMDVLYGLNAALRRYPWIDQNRLGIEGASYGGQLSAWLITQTHMFKAAIPTAAITNIISYNYMTYYNQYEAMEWGAYPHQGNLMDVFWERSALKHVANVVTPTMMVHGENDPDVPIAEAEQYYIALKDVGVETIMVRYPREGHGVRESQHNVDFIDRSIRWYGQHFPTAN